MRIGCGTRIEVGGVGEGGEDRVGEVKGEE